MLTKKIILVILVFCSFSLGFSQDLPTNIQSAIITKLLPYCRSLANSSGRNTLHVAIFYNSNDGENSATQLRDGLSANQIKIADKSFKASVYELSGNPKKDISDEMDVVIFVKVPEKNVKQYDSYLASKNILTIENYIPSASNLNTVIALSLSDQSKPVIFSSKEKLLEHNIEFSSEFLRIVKFK